MKRESPFKNIPSQFELIPDGVPVAFISYSWDVSILLPLHPESRKVKLVNGC